MKLAACLLVLMVSNLMVNAQDQTPNDTLYFKSGMVKTVHVIEHDKKFIKYTYVNSKGKQASAQTVQIAKLKYFVVYNSENQLEYSSLAEEDKKESTRE